MATGQSKWVGGSGDLVLQPVDARLAEVAGWALNSSNPLDVRPGIVYAGDPQLLNGTAGLSVNVDPFHYLSTKDTTNGVYQGTNKSTTAVTVPAAPSSGNKRTDLIWVAQQDKNALVGADATTQAVFGVVTGTATAGTPTKPALPTGCTEVGTVTWDSTSTVATATNAAQCTLATTGPWTVTRGSPVPVRSTTERSAITPYAGLQVLRLDSSPMRVETYDGSAWDFQDWTALTLNSGGVAGTWTATTGYPLQVSRSGLLIEVRGMATYSANVATNTVTRVPASMLPSNDVWLNMAIGSGTNWVANPLVRASSGNIEIPSGYFTGTGAVGMNVAFHGHYRLG